MTRPHKDLLCMAQAVLMSRMSTCRRLQVGCVVCDDRYEQIAVGYNGGYRGGPNDCLRNEVGGCGCVHAETNAVIKARFVPTRAFVTDSPCLLCAAAMINAGVTCVTYLRRYRDSHPIQVLKNAGVLVHELFEEKRDAEKALHEQLGLLLEKPGDLRIPDFTIRPGEVRTGTWVVYYPGDQGEGASHAANELLDLAHKYSDDLPSPYVLRIIGMLNRVAGKEAWKLDKVDRSNVAKW